MPISAAPHWTPAAIPDQTGRTALITGANSGIGLQTARVLATHGARVILAGRDRSRLDAAAAEIRAESPSADLDTLVLDLGSLDSIRAAAAEFVSPASPDSVRSAAAGLSSHGSHGFERESADGFAGQGSHGLERVSAAGLAGPGGVDSERGAAAGSVGSGSLGSSRSGAAGVVGRGSIDLLVNNAGVMNVPERRTTSDGFELTFGTNHLGHFALTALLLPALRRAPAARVVTVSAMAARWRSGELVDLMSERRYRPMAAYAKSKRANVVFTLELARRLAGTPISAVAVHPGAAMTNLQQHTDGMTRLIVPLLARFAMGSAEGAAWPSLFAATEPGVPSGAFLGPAGRRQESGTPELTRLPRNADDPAEGARLWAESESLTGIPFRV